MVQLAYKISSYLISNIHSRRVLNLETELYGLNAATAYAKEVIADLESQRTLKKHEEQLLNAKFRKIQDFEAKAVGQLLRYLLVCPRPMLHPGNLIKRSAECVSIGRS